MKIKRERALKDYQKYEEELAKIIRDNTGTRIDQINAQYDAEIKSLQDSIRC